MMHTIISTEWLVGFVLQCRLQINHLSGLIIYLHIALFAIAY